MCGRFGYYGYPMGFHWIGFWGIVRFIILGFLIILGIKLIKDKNLFNKNI